MAVASLEPSSDHLHDTARAPQTIMERDNNNNFPWPSALGFAFLTFNSITAIYHSDGDHGTIAFILVSYLDLLLLFWCLRLYGKEPANSVARERIKIAVWLLTTLLTMMFTWKVGVIMPLPVGLLAWLAAAVTATGGFYSFFLHAEK